MRTSLKWPNDLLAPDGRKLAGILAEVADGAVVVGVGLNVSTTTDELPATGTSLSLVADHPVDRAPVLLAYLRALRSGTAAGSTTPGTRCPPAWRRTTSPGAPRSVPR